MMKFSVLMSVYAKEKPEYFVTAVESILNQTLMPDEIVLVRDGEVPKELQTCIDRFLSEKSDLFTYIPLENNVGLGTALRHGAERVRNDWIMRMDTDDIAVSNRFELQCEYIKKHPEVDVLGGQIEEFIDDPDHIVCQRKVPLTHDEIIKFMKVRNPMSHMTVALKKEALIRAGNYIHMHNAQDYFMWCRMYLEKCVFANLPETLAYVRVGKEMYRRRGGYKYFCTLKEIEDFKLQNGMIGRVRYLRTLAARFIVQVLCPTVVRGFIFKKVARTKKKKV